MTDLRDRMVPKKRQDPPSGDTATISGAFSAPSQPTVVGERTRQLTVRVPEALHRDVRTYALAHDLSVQDFVRMAVIEAMRTSPRADMSARGSAD